MKKMTILVALLVASACGAPDTDLEAVSELELQRYLGTWYDVASFPQTFQEGCKCTTATYDLRDDGDISVLNRCRKQGLDGPVEEATARAFLPDENEPGKLKVEFFWPFAADYWVIELGDSGGALYDHAVVSEPSMQYLWILAREPAPLPEIYDGIVNRLDQMGFELERLNRTSQGACW